HVELVSGLRDIEMTIGFETSFAIAEFPRDTRPLVQPIHFAIAVQIYERIAARLAGDDSAVAKTQMARRRFIDPPFAAAVLKSHLQVQLAVLVDVVREMNFSLRIRTGGDGEIPLAIA